VTSEDPIGAGTLKLVVVHALPDTVRRAGETLVEHLRPEDVRPAGIAAYIIYTEADPSDVRGWIAPLLGEQDAMLVTEFERWSSHGDGIDRRWLLRRGH
jgi:hypothetical protein